MPQEQSPPEALRRRSRIYLEYREAFLKDAEVCSDEEERMVLLTLASQAKVLSMDCMPNE